MAQRYTVSKLAGRNKKLRRCIAW